jgi:4-diphosphocytidyl-2-C-methyl-D-erythritol kinase
VPGVVLASLEFPITVLVSAFAKINLGLHVLRRRADGFHDLETVFLRIGWADRIRFSASGKLEMTCTDPTLPTDERNLCVRAVRQLAAAAGEAGPPGMHIHLEKHLPHGAGLGGGSSDAAECLRFARTLLSKPLSDGDVLETAAALGSDVPFFLGSQTALGTGKGEVLTPIPVPNLLQGRYLAVVVPHFGISTAEAYAGITPNAHQRPDLGVLMTATDPGVWRQELVNDFEPHLFAAYPALHDIKSCLYDQGAQYSAMSGSGSAIFAVFDTEERAQSATNALGDAIKTHWVGPAAP